MVNNGVEILQDAVPAGHLLYSVRWRKTIEGGEESKMRMKSEKKRNKCIMNLVYYPNITGKPLTDFPYTSDFRGSLSISQL